MTKSLESANKHLYNIQNNAFNLFIVISYITYFLITFGIITSAPKYLSALDYYVKIYISLFLVIRFNPFMKITFTNLDRKIAFSSGIFLLTTTAINQILINYIDTIKHFLLQIRASF